VCSFAWENKTTRTPYQQSKGIGYPGPPTDRDLVFVSWCKAKLAMQTAARQETNAEHLTTISGDMFIFW